MSLKGVQHHLVHLCDVACANSEDDIAMMSTHRHHLCRGMHILHSANPILGRRVVKLKRLVHNGGGANRRIVLLLFTCGKMPVTITSSALANASANSLAKNMVRENRCGWKITRITDCGYLRRAASSNAEISVG